MTGSENLELLPSGESIATSAEGEGLGAQLRAIHNFIYANDGVKQHARVTDELVKLLFAKLHDERESGIRFAVHQNETETASAINRLFSEAIRVSGQDDVFDKDDRIKLSPASIAFAVGHLEGSKVREKDPKGVAFQSILENSLRAEHGQFFTPDPVKRLLIALTEPREGDVVCDPACGTAGLLTDTRTTRSGCGYRLRGIEVDAALARIARLNLYLAGEDDPEIFRTDALSPLIQLAEATGNQIREGSCEVVISNPPFGSRGKVTDPGVLSDLRHVTAGRRAVPPEVLFVERIVQLLKPGGRAGIVIPIGILSNPSLRHVRAYLHTNCQVYASVSLPPETFQPTGNAVNAAVVFIRRVSGPVGYPYPVFRAVSRSVGYDHRGKPLPDSEDDVPNIVEAWHEFFGRYGKDYLWG